MKKMCFMIFLLLFSTNVFALEGSLCTYVSGNNNIEILYYDKDGKELSIEYFKYNGEFSDANFDNRVNISKMKDPETGQYDCPRLVKAVIAGSDDNYFYILNPDADVNAFINTSLASGTLGEVWDPIGQIESIVQTHSVNKISVNISSSMDMGDAYKQLTDNIIVFTSGICTDNERGAIANHLTTNGFYEVNDLSGTLYYDGEEVNLTDSCQEVAYNLWNSTMTAYVMLYDAYTNGEEGIENTLDYLALDSAYSSSYEVLTNYSFTTNRDAEICTLIGADTINLLNMFFEYFRIFVVALTVIMVYLDGMKCLTNKVDDEVKKWFVSTIKRLVALIIVIILPLLINVVLDLMNSYFSSTHVVIDGECVKAVVG